MIFWRRYLGNTLPEVRFLGGQWLQLENRYFNFLDELAIRLVEESHTWLH